MAGNVNAEQLKRYRELAEYAIPTTFLAHYGHAIVALIAEVERLQRAQNEVPIDDIRKVAHAAEMDGYSNWRVDVWLDELAQQQQEAA